MPRIIPSWSAAWADWTDHHAREPFRWGGRARTKMAACAAAWTAVDPESKVGILAEHPTPARDRLAVVAVRMLVRRWGMGATGLGAPGDPEREPGVDTWFAAVGRIPPDAGDALLTHVRRLSLLVPSPTWLAWHAAATTLLPHRDRWSFAGTMALMDATHARMPPAERRVLDDLPPFLPRPTGVDPVPWLPDVDPVS